MGSPTGYQWPDPNAPLVFSFLDGAAPYAGDLANVVIYNRALTPAEVASLASLSSTPEPSTWAMMLLGFVALGFISYRKAKKGRATLAAA